MSEPTKADLVGIIYNEIEGNQYSYRRFIMDCVEKELCRWKKQELRDFLSPEPAE